MKLEYQIPVLAAIWVLAVSAIIVFAGTGSTTAWLAAGVLGLGLSTIVIRAASEQPQTLSGRIREARR
jgi:1-aminocyclopropane-1-carboxylate deaminase/D-cysteine desulfhydrase-like pyridoxal-dependent ACC family enzyme